MRHSNRRTLLIAVLLIVGVAIGAPALGRLLFASWSIGLLGRGTLTGDWVGTMRAKQGAAFGLFLQLNYKPRSGRGTRSRSSGVSNNLEGRATICTPAGERYDYAVEGYAGPLGGVDQLWLEYGDPKLSALNLRLSGEWLGARLQLEPDANPFMPDGRFLATRVLSGDDPDNAFAPIELVHGQIDTLTACRRQR